MIPVIYRYTIPVIYRYMYLLDVDVCRPSLLKNTTSRILFSFDCCLTSLENFFTNGDVNVIICLDLYTVSFFLRSSTIVCDIYTCCRALRTVATFTYFKTRGLSRPELSQPTFRFARRTLQQNAPPLR